MPDGPPTSSTLLKMIRAGMSFPSAITRKRSSIRTCGSGFAAANTTSTWSTFAATTRSPRALPGARRASTARRGWISVMAHAPSLVSRATVTSSPTASFIEALSCLRRPRSDASSVVPSVARTVHTPPVPLSTVPRDSVTRFRRLRASRRTSAGWTRRRAPRSRRRARVGPRPTASRRARARPRMRCSPTREDPSRDALRLFARRCATTARRSGTRRTGAPCRRSSRSARRGCRTCRPALRGRPAGNAPPRSRRRLTHRPFRIPEEGAGRGSRGPAPLALPPAGKLPQDVSRHEDEVRRTLGETAHEIWIPLRAERHVDAQPVALTRELLLEIAPHAVEHLEFETRALDPLLGGKRGRDRDDGGIVGRDAQIGRALHQRLHAGDVVAVHVSLRRKGDVRGFEVRALAQPDAAVERDRALHVGQRAAERALQHDADRVRIPRVEPFLEEVEGARRVGAPLHVQPDESAAFLRAVEDRAHDRLAQVVTDVLPHRGELHRDVRVERVLRDGVEQAHVLHAGGSGFGLVGG